MVIKKLYLKNFRNYADCEINYGEGINVVSGGNAQGKTNSAEAVFYLCTGYSPRATRDKQVIKRGEAQGSVKGSAVSRYGELSVEVNFFADKNKEIKVNGVPVAKIGELLGNINSVFFNPGELRLIQESPEDRRRFMDVSLSQLSRSYFYALQKYKKVLSQRNNLLKSEDRALVEDTLPVWDAVLAEAGAQIISARKSFTDALSPFAAEAHSYITDGAEELTVEGETVYGETTEEIREFFYNTLSERFEKDYEAGFTTFGPHRDDLKIKVNGTDVRIYGSQGQQRTAALSLKLAETEIFKDKFGEYPVLILDDAMSELDRSRRQKLIKRAENMQTIITCTEPESVPFFERYNNIHIEKGDIL
ncbi:MAG: DNA replication/repair protein RecF [Clostridia bacterium]|nr:DNA replication/repair protein RecF [Clostridia bacterium]